jgi:CheY-like chemotaxis protein
MVPKILVIDDQADIGGEIARMLRGYETTTETDSRRAVRRVLDGEWFDLVLCELQMPEIGGREVYAAFRRLVRPPIMLMMSGHDNVGALFAAGCPVLLKPFRAPELRELVSAILHDRTYQPAQLLQ